MTVERLADAVFALHSVLVSDAPGAARRFSQLDAAGAGRLLRLDALSLVYELLRGAPQRHSPVAGLALPEPRPRAGVVEDALSTALWALLDPHDAGAVTLPGLVAAAACAASAAADATCRAPPPPLPCVSSCIERSLLALASAFASSSPVLRRLPPVAALSSVASLPPACGASCASCGGCAAPPASQLRALLFRLFAHAAARPDGRLGAAECLSAAHGFEDRGAARGRGGAAQAAQADDARDEPPESGAAFDEASSASEADEACDPEDEAAMGRAATVIAAVARGMLARRRVARMRDEEARRQREAMEAEEAAAADAADAAAAAEAAAVAEAAESLLSDASRANAAASAIQAAVRAHQRRVAAAARRAAVARRVAADEAFARVEAAAERAAVAAVERAEEARRRRRDAEAEAAEAEGAARARAASNRAQLLAHRPIPSEFAASAAASASAACAAAGHAAEAAAVTLDEATERVARALADAAEGRSTARDTRLPPSLLALAHRVRLRAGADAAAQTEAPAAGGARAAAAQTEGGTAAEVADAATSDTCDYDNGEEEAAQSVCEDAASPAASGAEHEASGGAPSEGDELQSQHTAAPPPSPPGGAADAGASPGALLSCVARDMEQLMRELATRRDVVDAAAAAAEAAPAAEAPPHAPAPSGFNVPRTAGEGAPPPSDSQPILPRWAWARRAPLPPPPPPLPPPPPPAAPAEWARSLPPFMRDGMAHAWTAHASQPPARAERKAVVALRGPLSAAEAHRQTLRQFAEVFKN